LVSTGTAHKRVIAIAAIKRVIARVAINGVISAIDAGPTGPAIIACAKDSTHTAHRTNPLSIPSTGASASIIRNHQNPTVNHQTFWILRDKR
jgi:hypothetical protein